VRKTAFVAGARAVLPASVPISTWGLVTGIAMVQAGLSPAQAVAMTLLVFAGSAQLAALPLIIVHAPLWVILATAFVINLRFLTFSAGPNTYFRDLPLARRLLLSYLNGDLSFAIFVARTAAPQPRAGSPKPRVRGIARTAVGREAFFLGLVTPTWLTWQATSLLGIFLAGRLPVTWGLGVAGIVALIAPAVVQPQPTLLATVGRPEFVGGVVALLTMVRTRKLLLTLVLGMLAFTLVRLR